VVNSNPHPLIGTLHPILTAVLSRETKMKSDKTNPILSAVARFFFPPPLQGIGLESQVLRGGNSKTKDVKNDKTNPISFVFESKMGAPPLDSRSYYLIYCCQIRRYP
jgi:hypothetical protein